VRTPLLGRCIHAPRSLATPIVLGSHVGNLLTCGAGGRGAGPAPAGAAVACIGARGFLRFRSSVFASCSASLLRSASESLAASLAVMHGSGEQIVRQLRRFLPVLWVQSNRGGADASHAPPLASIPSSTRPDRISAESASACLRRRGPEEGFSTPVPAVCAPDAPSDNPMPCAPPVRHAFAPRPQLDDASTGVEGTAWQTAACACRAKCKHDVGRKTEKR
jgi:hypothetical protein